LAGWVFARVLQLGWSPAVFGEVDFEIREERTSHDNSHKRERFGKKYQWLAWYEALARLSGTQRFCDDAGRNIERSYESAWQLNYVRDIDPTHLLDQQAPDQNEHWRALWTTDPLTLDATVASVPSQDGPGLPEPEEPPHARTWWFPAERLGIPILPATEDPLETLAAWATDSTDLPDLTNYLVVRADLEAWVADGRTGQPTAGAKRFRLLTLSQSLLEHEDARDYPRPALHVSVMSILIARSDLDALEQLPADGQLRGFALDMSITDSVFLNEWPDSAAYLAECDPEFRPRLWQDAQESAVGLGVPAVVTADSYIWEGSLLDCSLTATLSVQLLSAAAAALFPGMRHLDGVGRTSSGNLLHVDPDPASGTGSALLIDESVLAEALQREDLALIQILRQSKRVVTATGDNRFAGAVNITHVRASVGEEVLRDVSRTHVDPPRLQAH
jgi:hypothetical protein